MKNSKKAHAHADFARVSPAEMKVVLLVCRGLTDFEAAKELGLSVRTVNVQRAHAMQRVGVNNVVALTLKAVCAGLVHPCKV